MYCYNNEDSEDAQLVLPKSERLEILNYYNNDETAGHYGIDRIMHTITSRYYWHEIQKDIERHVKECMECQHYKATNLKPARLYQTVSSNKRFEVVAIDLFGPLPTTPKHNQRLFIVKEIASRWVEMFPLEIDTTEACTKTLTYNLRKQNVSNRLLYCLKPLEGQIRLIIYIIPKRRLIC